SIPGQEPNPYQHNPHPYQQPQGPVPPNPYGRPTMPGGQPVPPGQPQFGPPPPVGPGPAAKKPVPGWLWGLGGAVLASAVWAGTLFATGGLGSKDEADFAGYKFDKELCSVAELKAFRERYEPNDSGDPDNDYGSQQSGLDQSSCSRSFKDKEAGEDDYSSAYIYTEAVWHKVTDPQGEFASLHKAREDQTSDDYAYETKSVDGFGDEAYLITERRGTSKDTLGGMTLAVRDGWFTFQMQWSWYGGGADEDTDPPTEAEVTKMLETDTRAALDALKKG
ncbi:hypothetical protein P8605_08395, partial [Streptomyces sp. T-3]|nr:hypothetical protein [Streptomyces sp. T-3]